MLLRCLILIPEVREVRLLLLVLLVVHKVVRVVLKGVAEGLVLLVVMRLLLLLHE